MSDDLLNNIEEAAQQPKSASGDEGSMSQFSIDEKIKADRYVRSQTATRTGLGLRFVKLVPPGQD